jgi:sugar lactone lactonase YvrE
MLVDELRDELSALAQRTPEGAPDALERVHARVVRRRRTRRRYGALAAALIVVLGVVAAIAATRDDTPRVVAGPRPAPTTTPAPAYDDFDVSPRSTTRGTTIELRYRDDAVRGIGFALDRWTGSKWKREYWLATDENGAEPRWDRQPARFFDIGFSGTRPFHLVVPPVALPGSYRICTANAKERRCSSLEVRHRTSRTLTPATLTRPASLASDTDGTLYVASGDRSEVVALEPNGRVHHVVAAGPRAGLAFHDGSLFVADPANHVVERIDGDGNATIVAGTGEAGFTGDGGPATSAKLNGPSAIAFGPDGATYIADGTNERVRKIDTNGVITTVTGDGTPARGGDGGPAVDASLDPTYLAFDGDGNLLVFSFATKTIRKIDPNGVITSLPQDTYASGLATAADGHVVVADYGNFGISRIDGNAITPLPFEHDGVFRPSAIAPSPNGDLYVADDGASGGGPMRIVRVGRDGSSGEVFIGR